MASHGEILDDARRLGLVTRGGGATGTIGGAPVLLETHWLNNVAVYSAWALLEPPMDLGLELHRRALSLSVLGGVGTGDPDLDAEYAAAGDEPKRVAAFFTPELREALVKSDRAGWTLALADRGAGVSADPYLVDEARALERAFEVALRVGKAAEAARATLPWAARLGDLGRALETLAAQRQLTLSRAPLRVHGVVDRREVALGAVRVARSKHHLVARARFAEELRLGLHVRRQGFLDDLGALVGRGDLETGDPTFDRRFLVRAHPDDEPVAAALFDADVRATLLEIDRRFGPVALDDRGVEVGPIPIGLGPELLPALLDLVVDAAVHVDRLALRPGSSGPYR